MNGVTLMVSLLDVGVLTGLNAYATAAERMWTDIVNRKMYVTGGVGIDRQRRIRRAVLAAQHLRLRGDVRRADVRDAEPQAVPGAAATASTSTCWSAASTTTRCRGVSLSGDRFFYVNRLASAGDGRDARWERASLECCPPNLVRFLASMPGYIYAQDGSGAIYVNLYVSSDATIHDRRARRSRCRSRARCRGAASRRLPLRPRRADVTAVVKLRIPGWARNRAGAGQPVLVR